MADEEKIQAMPEEQAEAMPDAEAVEAPVEQTGEQTEEASVETEEVTAPEAVPEQLLTIRKKGLWKRILLGILAAVLVMAAAVAVVIWQNEFTLDFAVEGSQEITLEVGSSFEDPGAHAAFSGSLLLRDQEIIPVTVDGAVNTDRLGSYTLTYTARKELDYYVGKLFFEKTGVRVVHVVDTTAPEITLLTDPEAFTLPGHTYVEEGFVATDNYDAEMTDWVVRWVEEDGVHYKVSDFSGNVTEVIRPIVYSDPVAPELTLLGKETLILVQGRDYQEPGYTAADNFDGDITANVTVTGEVDPKTLGEYPLTYTVADAHGNTTSAVRTVVVREYPELPEDMPVAEAVERVTPEGKVVYLTFDDGPSPYTEHLLNVLKKYDVKATFFVINRGYHDTLRRIVNEGHTIAMHGGSHTYRKIYASEEAYFADLKVVQDVILKETGVLATIVRFPGGTGNTVSTKHNRGIMTRLTKMLNAMNYRYFDWNVNSEDASGANTAEEIFNNVINGIMRRKVSIVLQHDIKYDSVMAVEDIIKWGLKNGYTFKALDMSSPTCEVKPRN